MKTAILQACVMRRLAANVPQNAVPQNAEPQNAVPCNTKTGTMRRLSDAQSVGSKLIAVLLENDRQIGLNPATKHFIAG